MRHAYIPFGYYTMIVDEPPLALRRPGQAFGLPNHYTTLRAAGYTGNVKFALPHALPQARIC